MDGDDEPGALWDQFSYIRGVKDIHAAQDFALTLTGLALNPPVPGPVEHGIDALRGKTAAEEVHARPPDQLAVSRTCNHRLLNMIPE